MTRSKGRFGYIYLDPQLDGKKKRRAGISQKSVFSPARERDEGSLLLSRLAALVLLLCGFMVLYFALR